MSWEVKLVKGWEARRMWTSPMMMGAQTTGLERPLAVEVFNEVLYYFKLRHFGGACSIYSPVASLESL